MTPIAPEIADLAVTISTLKPYPGNARIHDLDRISESLERNGQFRPIVVNRRTMQVLAGNGTLAAAKRLKWKQVAATFVDVDDETAARIVLADNRIAELGSYEPAKLSTLLEMVKGDLGGTGWVAADLQALSPTDPPPAPKASSFLDSIREEAEEQAASEPSPISSIPRVEAYPLPWAVTAAQRTTIVAAIQLARSNNDVDAPQALAVIADHYLNTIEGA